MALKTYAVYVRGDTRPPRVRAMRQGTQNEAAMGRNPKYRLVGVFPDCSAGRAAELGRKLAGVAD